jgi:hypothetical protein
MKRIVILITVLILLNSCDGFVSGERTYNYDTREWQPSVSELSIMMKYKGSETGVLSDNDFNIWMDDYADEYCEWFAKEGAKEYKYTNIEVKSISIIKRTRGKVSDGKDETVENKSLDTCWYLTGVVTYQFHY